MFAWKDKSSSERKTNIFPSAQVISLCCWRRFCDRFAPRRHAPEQS